MNVHQEECENQSFTQAPPPHTNFHLPQRKPTSKFMFTICPSFIKWYTAPSAVIEMTVNNCYHDLLTVAGIVKPEKLISNRFQVIVALRWQICSCRFSL